MLKFVLGGSGSGKTTLLYQRVKARAEAGQRSILLVPEQFTSSTEGRIYRELGDSLSGLVESFSFTSLAEKILSTEGGAAVQTLSDAGRTVLVRRALEELQDNVHYYYRHRRSAAFCQMAAETIDELKSAGLSGQQLYALARNCGTESGKLSELALIFQGYETLLAHTGMDPADRLELVRRGTADLPNVDVVPGGDYIISRATFPAYFLQGDPEQARCDLELTLFGKRIAPALGITRRFVGQEPYSPVTARYNQRMQALLPQWGIRVEEIPRLEGISASRVRQLLRQGRLAELQPLVPETTYAYCRDHFGAGAPCP